MNKTIFQINVISLLLMSSWSSPSFSVKCEDTTSKPYTTLEPICSAQGAGHISKSDDCTFDTVGEAYVIKGICATPGARPQKRKIELHIDK